MSEFHRVAKTSDVEEGSAICVDVNGTKIALFKVNSIFYALEEECPHMGGPMSRGTVMATMVECPLHSAQFCLKTGKTDSLLSERDLASYPTRVVDGHVEIEV